MTHDLVNVGNFLFVPEAEVARLHLQEAGIQAFLSNAEVVNMDWFLANAIGYVKILVPDDQAIAARGILETLQAQKQARTRDDLAMGDASACLSCGAKLPADQATCPECGWTYRGEEDADEEEDADNPGESASLGMPVDTAASLGSQAWPERGQAGNDGVHNDAAPDDAEELAETSATNLRLLIGLFLGGIVLLWLLPLLRAVVRSHL